LNSPETFDDPSPALREVVALLQQSGRLEAAAEFEKTCLGAHISGREWLMEIAVAIRRLRSSSDKALPREIEIPLRRVLKAVRDVVPYA
jgi:hypothetical protein